MALSATVLIVGSGPVGLWLALELRRAGVDVLIIDTRVSRDRESFSKALSIHAGSLDILDSRGLAPMFVAQGVRLPKMHFGLLRTFLELNAEVLGTRHPYNLAIPQARTEALLLTHCEEAGVRFEWGLKFVGLTQSAGTVVASVAKMKSADVVSEETVDIESAWLIGCDGTHSLVRAAAGIGFEGVPSGVTSVVADIQVTEKPPSDGPIAISRGAWGSGLFVTMGDGIHYRFAGMVREARHKSLSEPYTMEELKGHLRDAFGSDLGAHSPFWLSRFGSACRAATSFRAGRVLLAGDAAHQFPPAGGQGLNLGWQDATNLAWKIVFALREQERNPDLAEQIIESYNHERLPSLRDVIDNVLAQVALFLSHEPHENALRGLLEEALKAPEFNALWARRVTGLEEQRGAYLEGDQEKDLLAGKRLTHLRIGEDGGDLFKAVSLERFVLLLRQDVGKTHHTGLQAEASRWKDRVTVLICPTHSTSEQWDGVFAVLIRPDLYTAWVGREQASDEDLRVSLGTVFQRWFGVSDS